MYKKKQNKNKEKIIPYKRNYLTMISENNLIISKKIKKEVPVKKDQKTLKINYNISINKLYEINNLSYTNKIPKIDFSKANERMQSLELNDIELQNNLINKIIDKNVLFVRKIFGDGICYYRSLSFYFFNTQNNYEYFMKCIYNYITNNLNIWEKEFPYIARNEKIIPILYYIDFVYLIFSFNFYKKQKFKYYIINIIYMLFLQIY